MGPPAISPRASCTRYFTASTASAYFVAMPNTAVIHIQNTAPGPPSTTAVATPAILPVPMVAESAVIRQRSVKYPLAALYFYGRKPPALAHRAAKKTASPPSAPSNKYPCPPAAPTNKGPIPSCPNFQKKHLSLPYEASLFWLSLELVLRDRKS